MKNKIVGALVVLLIICNIVLIVLFVNSKKDVDELEKKVTELERVTDVQNDIIATMQRDVEALKVEQREK